MRIIFRVLFFLLCMCSGSLLHAQTDIAFKSFVAIKYVPLAFVNSSVRIGVEYNHTEKNAIYLELGKFEPFYGDKHNGFLFRTEYRSYRYEELYHNSIENNYFSFEFFYKHESYNVTDSSLGSTQTFSVAKDVGCFNWRFGAEKIFNCGFEFDISGGLGVRVKNGTNSLSAEENAHMQPIYDYGPNLMRNKAGLRVWPNFDFSFKIGYVFR